MFLANFKTALATCAHKVEDEDDLSQENFAATIKMTRILQSRKFHNHDCRFFLKH
jgi:hypothetical protein